MKFVPHVNCETEVAVRRLPSWLETESRSRTALGEQPAGPTREQVGGLDESLPCWMDYDFWIRVAATGAWIRGLHGDHFFYRQHGTSLSSEAKALRHELRAYLDRKHAGLLSLT